MRPHHDAIAERPPSQTRTFTETARRAQLVAAAIDTMAELGYAQTSLARIAERLEISTGVILYHFRGKDEIVDDVVSRAEAYMRPRIQAAPPDAPKLRASIESNLGCMAEYRTHITASVDISRRRELRSDVDPAVVALAIRGAIDGAGVRLAREPALDIDYYGQQLAALFEHATRPAK